MEKRTLENERLSIEEEIENVLRKMCSGMDYRELSEDIVDKLYVQICRIIEDDLNGQDNEVCRLTVTEEMVITAMIMHMNEN